MQSKGSSVKTYQKIHVENCYEWLAKYIILIQVREYNQLSGGVEDVRGKSPD